MAHHTDPELLNNVLQLLTEQGHSGFAEGLRARRASSTKTVCVMSSAPCVPPSTSRSAVE